MKQRLIDIYNILLESFGLQGWWPAKTRFEVVVGAILTQNTNWKNVEKVIQEMEKRGLLKPEKLRALPEKQLAEIIRPAGYFNQKARKLRCFLHYFFEEYDADMGRFSQKQTDQLRAELLDIWGIGPETADSILLYAAEKPTFVVDAYTRRVFSRVGLVDARIGYDQLKQIFEDNLPKDVGLFKEYHALIDELAKRYCLPKPLCARCPVKKYCASGGRGV
jgi:endonuclease-3 related protein